MFEGNLLNAVRSRNGKTSDGLAFNNTISFKNVYFAIIEKNLDKQQECDHADQITTNVEFEKQDLIDIRKSYSNSAVICYLNINNMINKIVILREICSKLQ